MWRTLTLSVLLLALFMPDPAAAARRVDVRERASLVLVGEKRSDLAGASVAAAGDVNGDGHADMIVDAPLADPLGRDNAGSAYVIFGPAPRGRLDLGALGRRGFRIDGARPLIGDEYYARTRSPVAGAGDVNGDGLADVIVGDFSTESFVVFGRRGNSPVDLAAMGFGGFRLPSSEGGSGSRPAGDINGDGLADIAVGVNVESDEEAGALVVVYGRPDGAPPGGFRVTGGAGGMYLGEAAAPAGDVNGDRVGDLYIGAPDTRERGAVFLLYGRRDAGDMTIRPGKRFGGREIRAPRRAHQFGASVARLGRDLVVGAPGARALGWPGTAWIIGRGDDPVRLGAPHHSHPVDFTVSVPGDVLGGPRREVLVVTRRRVTATARILMFSSHGRRLRAYRGTIAGEAADRATGVGDVGGSGRPDLLFGSPGESRAYLLTRP